MLKYHFFILGYHKYYQVLALKNSSWLSQASSPIVHEHLYNHDIVMTVDKPEHALSEFSKRVDRSVQFMSYYSFYLSAKRKQPIYWKHWHNNSYLKQISQLPSTKVPGL